MRPILNSILMALLGALALGSASAAATNQTWTFQVKNNGPESLTVGCSNGSGSAVSVGGEDEVRCQGQASSSTYVYFGDNVANRAHNCPPRENEATRIRSIAYSYDSNRTDSFQVVQTYCYAEDGSFSAIGSGG